MRCITALVLVAIIALRAVAQSPDDLAKRHAKIQDLYSKQAYAEVIKEIDAQRHAVKGTVWQDSLYSYIYQYGRAHWKTTGSEAATRAAEELWSEVDAVDPAPTWEVMGVLNLGSVYYDLGLTTEYLRVHSMALEMAKQHKDRIPPALLARAHYTLGLTHSDVGDNARSMALFDEALVIAQGSKPRPSLLMAKIYGASGACLRRLGRPRDGQEHFKRGMEEVEHDTTLLGLSYKAVLLGNAGILVQNMGDLEGSKVYYHKGISVLNELIERAKDDPYQHDNAILNRSRVYVNLATVYFAAGDQQRSREFLQLALRDRSAILGPDHPILVKLNSAFAEWEAMAGNLDRAEQLLREQLIVTQRTEGTESSEFAILAYKLARITSDQKEYERADSIYASVITRRLVMPDAATDHELSLALADRASMRMEQGRHDEALSDLRIAKTIREAVLGKGHEHLSGVEALLSAAALSKGDTATARQHADTALALLHRRIAFYRKPFVPVAFRDPYMLADAVLVKVSAERGTGNEQEQLDLLDLGITSLQRNKASVSDEGSRLLLIGSQKQLFDLAMDLAHEAYTRSHDPKDLQRFLDLSESDRSILLKSRLNEFSGLLFAGVPDSVISREQQLLKALDVDIEDQAAFDELNSRESAYAAFLDSLAKAYPKYHALRYGEPRVTLEQIRKQLLTSERSLLVFAFTGDHLHALVVRTDTAALVSLNGKGVADAVKKLNEAVAQRGDGYFSEAYALYQKILAPVRGLLRGDELLIVPDGPLHTLNFELLLTKPSTMKDFREHLLLQEFAIADLLSVTTAVQFAELARTGKEGVLALAPGFDDELKQNYLTKVSDSSLIDRRYLGYVRQPFAVNTAEALGGRMSARVLLGGDATEKNFRSSANEYGILHLGTHAEMNTTAPMYSRLVLSKDGVGVDPDADGYLHAYEIYELDLRAQLAVLTACETGAGKNDDGEGVRSLGYSFAYAGCPSLVMSLWNIDEKVSSEIITRFYEHLADGMPKHEALRQAKLDHLANAPEELALPYYWAGLVLVGDVAPVTTPSMFGSWLWWIIGAVVAALLGMLLLRRKSRSLV